MSRDRTAGARAAVAGPRVSQGPLVDVVDGAVADPAVLAAALRPRLGPHPAPQSDPRTRGLLLEIGGDPASRAWLRSELPPLAALLPWLPLAADGVYAIAVNESPPSDPDRFFMRPHVDRRWLADGFGRTPPRWTTVVYLDFPAAGAGGELVVFPPNAFDGAAPVPRKDARRTVARRGGRLISPTPGRACRLAGDLPHAVLGYAAAEDSAWRLAAVIAEFPAGPGEPPPRGLLSGADAA